MTPSRLSPETGVRLNKYLAEGGVASRRGADSLITAGRVTVNGVTVTELAVKVVPGRDRVSVDGRGVKPAGRLVYLVMNKARGVVTTSKDPERRATVLDAVTPAVKARVFPVGRLDRDSEGLLLLTNDGELALRLTHPRYRQEKVYKVWLEGAISQDQLTRLREGIELEGKKTLPAWVSIERRATRETVLKFKLREGRRRQIRRMCEATGHRVRRLVRVAEGPVRLGQLRPGDWRHLTGAEVKSLRRAAGLSE